jgi:hypothetical protein
MPALATLSMICFCFCGWGDGDGVQSLGPFGGIIFPYGFGKPGCLGTSTDAGTGCLQLLWRPCMPFRVGRHHNIKIRLNKVFRSEIQINVFEYEEDKVAAKHIDVRRKDKPGNLGSVIPKKRMCVY